MKTKLHSFFIVLALFAGVYTVAAQGTDFTYQGRLNNASGPANGIYDITYKLWNASGGGAQVGSTFTVTGTPVTNGLFTATIGFGNVFNGSSYWLELAVRTNGVGSYQTLIPRQALMPTPYAITAENVDGAVPASQLSGTIPSSSLNGTYGGPLTLNNPANIYDGNGAGLTSLNASQLTSGTVPDARLGANVALLNANQTFTGSNTFNSGVGTGRFEISSLGTSQVDTSLFTGLSLQYAQFTGEGAIMASYNSLGGGDGFLSFYTKANGTPVTKQMIIDYFGVVSVDQGDFNAGFLNNGNTNGAGLTFGTTSGEGIASQRTAGVDQFSLEFYTAFINRMIIMNNGFVGIGTTNPAAQLEVDNADTSTDSIGIRGVSGGGNAGELHSQGFYNAAGEFVGANGVIGVGTTNQFDSFGVLGIVGGSGYGVYGDSTTASGTGVYATSAGTGSALTIGSGAIHVSGASTNSTTTAAFIQVATASNIDGGDGTIINNTLCNGDSNAILLVTPNWNPHLKTGVYWNHVVGVYYAGSNWRIFNEDLTTMPAGPAFNVLIIKN